MYQFIANSATEAWQLAVNAVLSELSSTQSSRGGETIELLHCMFELQQPAQRWISRTNPIKPAFAIAELVWILRGRNDVAFLSFWLPSLTKFVGSNPIAYGAYGFRMRNHFAVDQLELAYNTLLHNPDSRQVVLQLWDPRSDLPNDQGRARSQDIPCNISSIIKLRQGRLEWTQIMRSNDLFRGTPYNFIQFTTLQEVMAGWLGVTAGSYCHWSDSLHAYKADLGRLSKGIGEIPLKPTSSLALPKKDSDVVWRQLEMIFDELINGSYTKRALINLSGLDLPMGHNELLKIVLAEAAGRNGWRDTEFAILDTMHDPSYRFAAKVWMECRPSR